MFANLKVLTAALAIGWLTHGTAFAQFTQTDPFGNGVRNGNRFGNPNGFGRNGPITGLQLRSLAQPPQIGNRELPFGQPGIIRRVPIARPVPIVRPVPVGQPVPVPFPVFRGRNTGDLDNYLEQVLGRRYGRALRDVDVNRDRFGNLTIEVETRDWQTFAQVRNSIALICRELKGNPIGLGPRTQVVLRNFDDILERQLERDLARFVDDVDVDLDRRRRRIEIDIEVDDIRFAPAVRNYILSLPELRGYRVDLEIDD